MSGKQIAATSAGSRMSRRRLLRGSALAAGALAVGSQRDGKAALTQTAATSSASPPAGWPLAFDIPGLAIGAAISPAAGASAPDPVARSAPRVFADDDFQFQFLATVGQAYERAADVGECFAAAAAVQDGDYDGWFTAFHALAERVQSIAEVSAAAGAAISAREAFLRAATYYGAAAFFADGSHDPSRLVPTWEAHRAAFDAFAARLDPPAEQVQIPYEGTTLPGYALTVDASGRSRPWLIMNNGSDGTAADMWSAGAAAALRRGYNTLIFDGPGQGAALYRQRLYFRPDWEQVITPVVDWLLTRADVDPDRIAILGISQGGYWAPRAVAFEHRIAAAIADPGVIDVATSWPTGIPPAVAQALRQASGDELARMAAEIDQEAAAEAAKSPRLAFALAFRMRPYGTTSLAEALRRLAAYDSRSVVGQIRCPMLIADPEGEQFWPGQSQELYDLLPGPKTLVRFTAGEGADLHCEPKALGLRAQRFFDWLDATL